MENQTPLRLGIVGCGYQGGILAQTMAGDDGLRVTACADPNQGAAARVAAITGNYGRQGAISLRGVGFTYSVEVVSSALPAYEQPTRMYFPQVADLRLLMHGPQLAEFAQAIQERRQPSCTVTDGRRVLKVLDACLKSDRTGQPVRVG